MAVLYLVVRNMDSKPRDEYGVQDDFTIVYASFDKDRAEQAKEDAEHRVEMHNLEIEERLSQRVDAIEKNWKAHTSLPFDREQELERLERYEGSDEIRCALYIVEVETDKAYDLDKEPTIGGSWYIE